jgi:hypothetical protein
MFYLRPKKVGHLERRGCNGLPCSTGISVLEFQVLSVIARVLRNTIINGIERDQRYAEAPSLAFDSQSGD